tara:strand:- start:16 stop:624 length:609 start_codon:yes stop_codon:yes gene_type:complete
MIMEPFEVYRSYLALRLHFTTDKYDVIKQKGKVRASKQAFFKRTDLISIRKISKEYSDKEVINFLVANFVSGDRWGGIFDSDSKQTYLSWKKRLESITYTFKKDLQNILYHMEKNKRRYSEIFISQRSQHPDIMKLYLQKEVSIETLVILNKINKFVSNNDILLEDDILWPDVSRLIRKYTPFLNINKEKYDGFFRERFRYN